MGKLLAVLTHILGNIILLYPDRNYTYLLIYFDSKIKPELLSVLYDYTTRTTSYHQVKFEDSICTGKKKSIYIKI